MKCELLVKDEGQDATAEGGLKGLAGWPKLAFEGEDRCPRRALGRSKVPFPGLARLSSESAIDGCFEQVAGALTVIPESPCSPKQGPRGSILHHPKSKMDPHSLHPTCSFTKLQVLVVNDSEVASNTPKRENQSTPAFRGAGPCRYMETY